MKFTPAQLKPYLYLMRLNKPIGILLLLWPTLWALWLASNGHPDVRIVTIFVAGVIIMRSAGCVINDFADRKWDAHVERTRERPLATGQVSTRAALILFVVLILAALLLVLQLNTLTVLLAVVGAILTVIYPFLKRITHLPQLGLGIAFAWGVPMAFTAVTDTVSMHAWLVFFAAAIWPVIYDTMYAMVDYTDDVKVGIMSTAILFGPQVNDVMGGLQLLFLWLLIWVGIIFQLNLFYFLGLYLAALLFGYQLWLIKDGDRKRCFKAFMNNHWVGLVIFLGIVLA